jgi:predicted DNA-binding transcriptional regulator AlpA
MERSLDMVLLDAEALGRVLGLTRAIIYRLAKAGDLPSIKILRRCVRFERVAKWLLEKCTS